MQRVTRSEIASLAGVSRAAVTLWGKRSPDFPRPGDDDRFLLVEVLEWLERRKVRGGRGGADQADESYADRVRRSLDSAAATELPAVQLPGESPMVQADNLTLQLTLVFLRTRDPQAWAGIDMLIPPDTGAAGARWLLGKIAAAAIRAAERHGVRPEIFGALTRLTPELVAHVRGVVARCATLSEADVQAIVDEYEAALPAGTFLTPSSVATLLAEAVIDGAAESVYDPYLRGGELLTAAAGRADLRLHGLGPSPAALSLSGLNLLARGETADLRPPDAAFPPPVTHILANPPFGTDSWIDRRPDTDWLPYPVPPARSPFRWLLHCLRQLRDGGRIAIIMPPISTTSVSSREQQIRQRLIDQSMVEAVFALPAGLYVGRSIATCVWIVRHPPGVDQPILFVDAGDRGVPGDGRSMLDAAGRAEILQAWRSFVADRDAGRPHHGTDGLSVAVPSSAVCTDNHSLNPADYVSTRTPPPQGAVDDARADLPRLYRQAIECSATATEAMTAVGEPAGLEVVKIGDVCDVKTGYSYSALPAGKRSTEDGVPIILPRHLRNGRIVADNPPRAPYPVAYGLVGYEVHAGDVLCVRTGALTPPAIVGPDEAGRLVSTNLLRLRVHDSYRLDPYFLYAYLRSAAGTAQMKTFARSTATAYVTAADVAAMEIPLPSPNRQRSLADALRALDEEVAAAEELALQVAEARDAATRQLLGGSQ